MTLSSNAISHLQVVQVGTTLRDLTQRMNPDPSKLKLKAAEKVGITNTVFLKISHLSVKLSAPNQGTPKKQLSHKLANFWRLCVCHTSDTHEINVLCLFCFVFSCFSLPFCCIFYFRGFLWLTESTLVSADDYGSSR